MIAPKTRISLPSAIGLSWPSISARRPCFRHHRPAKVAGADVEVRDIGAGAKELVAPVDHQLVRKRDQLARRGGVDGHTLRDGAVKTHGHDDIPNAHLAQSDL